MIFAELIPKLSRFLRKCPNYKEINTLVTAARFPHRCKAYTLRFGCSLRGFGHFVHKTINAVASNHSTKRLTRDVEKFVSLHGFKLMS